MQSHSDVAKTFETGGLRERFSCVVVQECGPPEWRLGGTVADFTSFIRGSKYLKSWMKFLEENSDLRYPNMADILANG